jgi:hypothetical protein
MAKISQILGGHGPAITVSHGGKDYKARPLMQEVKAEWERWVESRAMRPVLALREHVTAAEFAALVRDAAADVASGRYAFGGELSNSAMSTPGGGIAFTAIVFGVGEDEAIRLIEAKGAEIQAALYRVMEESQGAAPEGAAPNS